LLAKLQSSQIPSLDQLKGTTWFGYSFCIFSQEKYSIQKNILLSKSLISYFGSCFS